MGEKSVTLDVIFAEMQSANRAFADSPEGQALEDRVAAKMARERAAQDAYAATNPDTPYQTGQDAALRGEDRNPPDDLEGEAAAEWYSGYDYESDASFGEDS